MPFDALQPATGAGQIKAPDYQTKKQLAARLGVSVRTIETLMAAGKLPYIRLTRKIVRFPTVEVDAYFARNLRVKAVGE